VYGGEKILKHEVGDRRLLTATMERMRTSICFRHAGVVRRLICVTESKAGIYVSHVLCGADIHMSYHTDGTCHTKQNGLVLGLPMSRVPIAEVKGVHQVVHMSVALALPALAFDAAYLGDQATETVLMLYDSLLSGTQQRFSLDVWLFDRPSENTFYSLPIHTSPSAGQALADVVSTLDNFAGHKLALSFRAQPSYAYLPAFIQ
jgi:hypothetical protein